MNGNVFIQQILGIDSEFCMIESFVTGVVDNWPTKLRKHRKLFTFAVAFSMFILSLSMLTEVRSLIHLIIIRHSFRFFGEWSVV